MPATLVFFVLIALLIPLALYLLIQTETESTTVVDRTEAERSAQEFGGLEGRRDRPRSREAGGDTTSNSGSDSSANADDHHQWGDRRLKDDQNR